jgi:tetratricopeptide (TPR) repeat protein
MPGHGARADQDACAVPVGRLVSIEGHVETRHPGGSWEAASSLRGLCTGDAVRVLVNSRAALQLTNRTVLRLDANSTLVLGDIKPEAPSWLDLLRGALNISTRVPRALEIRTPYVNAGVEGTEFSLRVDETQTSVSVLEGTVKLENDIGMLALFFGQSAVVRPNSAPVLNVEMKPRDAVRWSFHYPRLLVGSQGVDSRLAVAELDLAVGRVENAETIIEAVLADSPEDANALALRALIALVTLRLDDARDWSSRAYAAAPDMPSVALVRSAIQQADFDLHAARETVASALESSPGHALLWARRARLDLALGDLASAQSAVERARELDPELAEVDSTLGFVALARNARDTAEDAFEIAARKDPGDPLPHFGLGLLRVNQGRLEAGRDLIELAVNLAPGVSLSRSYLGKAYFELRRDDLAETQWQLARELDPNDPTPWFYDALRLQAANRPGEALDQLEEAMARNDRRGVYRSRLLLDSDLASRNAAQARIYTDLGFDQLALNSGGSALAVDPAEPAAHRLLADSYLGTRRLESARLSELLQAQLLTPLNTVPLQPQLAAADLGILAGAGPSRAGANEFNPLFARDGWRLQANVLAGSDSTFGDDLVIGRLSGDWMGSFGQFHYATDGYRDNADQKSDIYNLFLQGRLTPDLSLQVEYRDREREFGDLELHASADSFDETKRVTETRETFRLGAMLRKHETVYLASLLHVDGSEDQFISFDVDFPIGPGIFLPTTWEVDTGLDSDGTLAELQAITSLFDQRVVLGAGYYDNDSEVTFDTAILLNTPIGPLPVDNFSENVVEDIQQSNAYLYTQIAAGDGLDLTLGLSGDDLDGVVSTRRQLNPKFGLRWQLDDATVIRAAGLRVLKRGTVSEQTLEPTQVAGFNQLYDDDEGTERRIYGVALERRLTRAVDTGIEWTQTDIERPYFDFFTNSAATGDWEESVGKAWLYWRPDDRWALGAEYLYEKFERDASEFNPWYDEVTTHEVPLWARYHHPSGFSAGLRATHIDQEGLFRGRLDGTTAIPGSDDFWTVDASVAYRLPKRQGMLSFEIRNLFDEEFVFEEIDDAQPRVQPEMTAFVRITLSFD